MSNQKESVTIFNGSYFEQIEGSAMGIPQLAPLVAEVRMNWIISETFEFECQPETFFCYVGDCFAIFSNKKIEIVRLFNKLCWVRPQVQFTVEYETENQLLFFDVFMEKETDIDLQLSICCKSTHYWILYLLAAFRAHRYTLNLLKCLLNKPFKICSNRLLMQKEFNLISKLIRKNGCQNRFIPN